MGLINGVVRTTTYAETNDYNSNDELKAARRRLSEVVDENETLRLALHSLKEEIAKLKELNDILTRKSRYTTFIPPHGV